MPEMYTTGATSGAGVAYPSGAPELTPDFIFIGVLVTLALVFHVCLCNILFQYCIVKVIVLFILSDEKGSYSIIYVYFKISYSVMY